MAETLSTTELLEKINRLVDLLERALVKRELYPPRLTKYEIARIIGARATQLAMGAQPLVDVRQLGTIDPVLIAMCITNAPREPVVPTFYLVKREPPLFVCAYCGRYHELSDLI